MKKILLLFLCILSFNATYADVTWNLSDDGTLTISGTGDMENYLGLKGAPWCEQKNNIKTVVIENGVTSIGDNAFFECQNMVSVTIPNSVTVIGIQAFYHCTSLASIKFPKFLRTIQIEALSGCSCLTSITIPKSVQYIKEASFSHCSGLVSIEVEEGNKKYDSRNNCNAIIETSSNSLIVGCSNTIIPNSITSIGASAFSGCTRLASVIIPNSVTSIARYAFAGCKGLTSITIPNSVTNIGEYAFHDCKELSTVTIGNSVTSIREFAFYQCTGLTSVTIPNSVTTIGESSFGLCSNLTSFTIPEHVTKIENGTFEGCSNLASITIPNSITSIGASAFSGCTRLASVIIPNSVTNLGDDAFAYCKGLTSITIPKSINIIGDEAFYGCINLKEATIFTNNSLEIGTSVFGDENFAFGDWWYSSSCLLKKILMYGETLPAITKNDFINDKSIYWKTILAVPSALYNEYCSTNPWNNFSKIVKNDATDLTDDEGFYNGLQLNERNASYTRNFTNTAWQALYIPFSLKYDDWKDDFEIAYINGVRQLDKDDNGTIDETIMDVIKIKSGSTTPNMPYLIKAKTTGEKTFSVNNATLYAAEENSLDCSTTIAKYTFIGTYSSIHSETMIANGYYAMGGGDLIQSDGSNDLKPYRWYMKVESRNPSVYYHKCYRR